MNKVSERVVLTHEAGDIEQISIDKIDPPIFVRYYPDKDIEKLVNSMKSSTQLQNIVVRPNGNGGVECVSGWGRVQAAKKLGWKEILAKKIEVEDNEVLILSLSENLCRKDLSTMERERMLYKVYTDNEKMGYRKLAIKLGISYEWLRTSVKAYEIRQTCGKDWEKVSGHLTSDLVLKMEKIPSELRGIVATKIKEGEIKADIVDIKQWVSNYVEGDEELKKKMMESCNTTAKMNDNNEKPVTFDKILSSVRKVELPDLDVLESVQKEQVRKNLQIMASLIMSYLQQLNIIKNDDYTKILKILKVKPEQIQDFRDA